MSLFRSKILWVFTLIAVTCNLIFSIITVNTPAIFGWFVALCWFPYEKLSQTYAKEKVE